MAGAQPDAATLAALLERTEGNPFYLTESARLLGSEGGLVATSKVPEGVRDVLRRRLARLPELTVSVLRLAAVIGRDIDIDVLVGAAEVDEDAVLDALEAGVLAGLLTEPAAGSVRFAHVLVRDTLYEDAPRVRRGRWHARVATAVAAVHPDDPAALAHHYHQAGSTATARLAVDATSGRPSRRWAGTRTTPPPSCTRRHWRTWSGCRPTWAPTEPRRWLTRRPAIGGASGTACPAEPFANGCGLRGGRPGQQEAQALRIADDGRTGSTC